MIRLRARLAALVLMSSLAAASAMAGPIDLSSKKFADEKLNRAILLLGQGDLRQADIILQEILQKDPTQVYALLAQTQVAMSERRLADADRSIAAVLAKTPNLPAAHAMKGVVLMLQKRPDEARFSFRRAVELQPAYVTPRFYLAVIARSKGEYAAAATEYKGLTEVAPGVAAGYLGQAEAQMMLRNPQEAFRILQSWKSVTGAGVIPFQVLANLHLARNEPADAIKELQAALVRAPGDSATLSYLGDAYVASGDQQKAVESYRAALQADPRNQVANNNLAWLLAEQSKDMDEALRLALAATRIDPNYVDALDTLGWVQYRRAEYPNAVTTLAKATKIAPDRTDIAAHLGLAYAKTGSKARALTELRRALAGKAPLPNRPELERVVAELSSSK